MENKKVILLVELTLRPECVAEVLAVADQSRARTVQEPGCELMLRAHKAGQPNVLVLYEVFKSKEAHEWHLQQDYAKAFFAIIECKLLSEPSVQQLEE